MNANITIVCWLNLGLSMRASQKGSLIETIDKISFSRYYKFLIEHIRNRQEKTIKNYNLQFIVFVESNGRY